MKKILLPWIALLFCPAFLFSQTPADSIAVQQPDADTQFSVKQVILPASLIVLGAFGVENGKLKSLNESVRDELVSRNVRHIPVDDYMQYLPAVSVYGLSLAGVKAKHYYTDRTLIMATAYLSAGCLTLGVKYTVKEPRPDTGTRNSFPSGHTATAFTGAEIVRREYNDASPWYGVAAYTIAIGTGALRVYNDRHWTTDVIAGAGVGILSAQIGYWLLPLNQKLFRNCPAKTTSFHLVPYYTGQQGGVSMSYQF